MKRFIKILKYVVSAIAYFSLGSLYGVSLVLLIKNINLQNFPLANDLLIQIMKISCLIGITLFWSIIEDLIKKEIDRKFRWKD